MIDQTTTGDRGGTVLYSQCWDERGEFSCVRSFTSRLLRDCYLLIDRNVLRWHGQLFNTVHTMQNSSVDY